MPELSNLVRQRLGARPAPPTHPDADTLTAYVEQVLPSGERNQVVEHLAACSFCRDIVDLSVPELPEKTMVQDLPVPSRFWKFGLRWAGALAVIVIAVTLVLERPGTRQRAQGPVTAAPHTDSDNSQKAAEPVGTEKPPVLTSSGPSQTRSAGLPVNTQPLARVANQHPAVAPPPVPVVMREDIGASQNLKDVSQFSYNSAVSGILEPSSKLQKPASLQKNGFVNNGLFTAAEHSYASSYNEARQEQAKAEAERAKKESSLALAAPPADSEQDTSSHKGFLRKAFPVGPITASVLNTVKLATVGAPSGADARASDRSSFAPTPVRPPISQGSVARTTTTITHGPTDSRRAKTASSEPEQLHWRVQDGKLVNSSDLNQWHEASYPQSDEIQFKVVQAQGHEVWAGGTNGTLVHSWDGGVDWQKLNLGDAASGDIEKISLSGGDVQVKTSNGQHLISRDGGKTWAPLNPPGNTAQPNQPK
jgi:hypothetical protein